MAVGFPGKVSELDVAGPAVSGATERKGILKNATLQARIGRTYTPPTHLSEPMKKTAKRLEFAWPVHFDPNHVLPQGEVYPRSKPKWQKFVPASDPRTNLEEGDPSELVDVREYDQQVLIRYELIRRRPRVGVRLEHTASLQEFVLAQVKDRKKEAFLEPMIAHLLAVQHHRSLRGDKEDCK